MARTRRDLDDHVIIEEELAPPGAPARTWRHQGPPTDQNEGTEPAARPQVRGSGSTARTGVYFRTGDYEAAKAAFLSDWDNLEDCPDTFGGWIGAAVRAHAALSPLQRARVNIVYAPKRRGTRELTRTFNFTEAVIEAMRAAMTLDRRDGQAGSQSQFCAIAITAAVEAARERAGGNLPPAPPRLPGRLVR